MAGDPHYSFPHYARGEFLSPESFPPPLGMDLLLLTSAGRIILGKYPSTDLQARRFIIGWTPLPEIPYELEQTLKSSFGDLSQWPMAQAH